MLGLGEPGLRPARSNAAGTWPYWNSPKPCLCTPCSPWRERGTPAYEAGTRGGRVRLGRHHRGFGDYASRAARRSGDRSVGPGLRACLPRGCDGQYPRGFDVVCAGDDGGGKERQPGRQRGTAGGAGAAHRPGVVGTRLRARARTARGCTRGSRPSPTSLATGPQRAAQPAKAQDVAVGTRRAYGAGAGPVRGLARSSPVPAPVWTIRGRWHPWVAGVPPVDRPGRSWLVGCEV